MLASRHDPVALAAFVALTGATLAIAWRTDAAIAAVPAAAVLAVLVIVRWALDLDVERYVLPSGPVAGAVPEPPKADVGWHLVLGAGFAVLFGAAGYLGAGTLGAGDRSDAVVRIGGVRADRHPRRALLSHRQVRALDPVRRRPRWCSPRSMRSRPQRWTSARRAPGSRPRARMFATGAVAALALALTMALEKGWLTIALALMVPGIAWVAERRPLPALRLLAAVIGVLVLVRIGWEPRIVGRDVGTTPIFNWLLYGYGVPAAAFWLGGYLLRRRADDVPARTVDSGAILLTVAAGVPRNPPPRPSRRHLPRLVEPRRARAAGLRRARHGHRARARCACAPAASSTTSARSRSRR